MVDGFLGLGHNAVIGGDDQDGDVGDAGAAGADGGKGFVAGGVEEGNFVALVVHLVGADVLGDAADFAVGDMGAADGVEEAGFAVVDMAEDGDYRGTGIEVGGVLDAVAAAEGAGFGDRFSHAGADAIGGGDQGGHFVVDDLVHRDHNAVTHQLLDDFHGSLVDEFGQVLDGQGLRQHQGAGRAATAAFSGSGRHSIAPMR